MRVTETLDGIGDQLFEMRVDTRGLQGRFLRQRAELLKQSFVEGQSCLPVFLNQLLQLLETQVPLRQLQFAMQVLEQLIGMLSVVVTGVQGLKLLLSNDRVFQVR